jgi:hypothetical protein
MAEKFMTVLNNNHSLTHYIYDVFSNNLLVLNKDDFIKTRFDLPDTYMNENTSNKKLNKLFIL